MPLTCRNQQIFPGRVTFYTRALFLVVCLGLCGCSIWDSYVEPDYHSSRADRLCHPYGNCSQGEWVAVDGTAIDSGEAHTQCIEMADQRQGNGWWADSISRGLDVGGCMESKGFRLRP
ncbi:MAG: hypothetical protein OEY91_01300 [Nitrospirota bacterium]|nr:hypothetical protein [Nitrospirota bacterium]